MCGRFGLNIPARQVAEHFELDAEPELAPRHNIAPTQPVACVLRHPDSGARVLRHLQWGLVPSWAKDPKRGARLINARSETAATKPSFRQALADRRCLIPASGFYEWEKLSGGKKQPHFFSLQSRRLMAFAGLWEHWRTPDGRDLFSCTILTTEANALVGVIHERMPVILPPQSYTKWLAPQTPSPQTLLTPFDARAMQSWPVSERVNATANDGPDLALPLPL